MQSIRLISLSELSFPRTHTGVLVKHRICGRFAKQRYCFNNHSFSSSTLRSLKAPAARFIQKRFSKRRNFSASADTLPICHSIYEPLHKTFAFIHLLSLHNIFDFYTTREWIFYFCQRDSQMDFILIAIIMITLLRHSPQSLK